MPRTKGAKNQPPDPETELAKVRALYAQRNIPFPGDLPAASVERAAYGGDDTNAAARSGDGNTAVFITNEEQPAGVSTEFECGNCGADLPGAVAVCPYCGSTLEWA